jgi:hypothetical protein
MAIVVTDNQGYGQLVSDIGTLIWQLLRPRMRERPLERARTETATRQYALSNQLFVSRYQLYLPSREQLEGELSRLLQQVK